MLYHAVYAGGICMPYRGYLTRFKKWSSKFDPDTVRSRFSQVQSLANDLAQEQFANLVQFETEVKNRLNELGVPVIQMPFYLNVARQIYRAMTKHSGKTLEAEVKVIKATWTARGLDPTYIDEITKLMIGYVPAY